MKRYAILISLIVFVFACKKEQIKPTQYNTNQSGGADTLGCPSFSSPDSMLQTLFGWSDVRYMMPHFNPNNNDEFLYVDQIYQSPYAKLCVHSISTGETQVILEGQTFLTQPRWHSNGWVLFRGNANVVFKIKGNGDSLSTVNDQGIFLRPIWRPDGQAWISEKSSGFTGNIEIFDLEGIEIDVIPGEEVTRGDWSADNRIVTTKGYSGSNQFTWTDAGNLNWQDLTFDTNSPHKPALDVHWIPMSDDVMYSQLYESISKINIFTGNITEVREGCGGRYYRFFSISNDCSQIIAERIQPDTIFTDGFYNFLIQKSEIVLMNFDGTGEEVIELP